MRKDSSVQPLSYVVMLAEVKTAEHERTTFGQTSETTTTQIHVNVNIFRRLLTNTCGISMDFLVRFLTTCCWPQPENADKYGGEKQLNTKLDKGGVSKKAKPQCRLYRKKCNNQPSPPSPNRLTLKPTPHLKSSAQHLSTLTLLSHPTFPSAVGCTSSSTPSLQ